MPYQPRIVDSELASRLEASGAVVIEGPKACGKTETARQRASSEVLLDIDQNARQAVAVDPGLVLVGPTPRLIDEWQVEPEIWNQVRREVDARKQAGQFILTGSAVPPDDARRHSGAGRISHVRMRPMSLFELGYSNGNAPLAGLLAGENFQASDPGLTVGDLAREVSLGGWPGLRGLEPDQGLIAVRDYLDEICRVDVNRVDNSERNPDKIFQLVRSLARNTTTYASAKSLATDAGDDGALNDRTVRVYLDLLSRLMIVENQPSWAPHLRSRYRLRSAPKWLFVDPSIAVAALRATPERLLGDLNLFGLLFESMIIRDLRVYAQANDAQVLQYRDSNDHEVDAIIETADGRWAAIEIKLGTGQIDFGASQLKRFVEQIDLSKCGHPAALAIITATGYGYRRTDGIQVIPAGALGP